MKKVTTTIIALISIATSVIANNSTTVLAGSTDNNNVVLNFSASNNSRFEIERSFYSNNFTTIATLQSAFVSNFRINDNAAELAGRKIAYYRVKQIAADGTVTYSNTTVVNLEGTPTATVTKNTNINFTAAQNGNAVIKVMSTTGKTVIVNSNTATRGNNTVAIATTDLSKGIYTAVVSVNGVVVATQKVIAE
ncbi:MAG: T9SS type A sorting domain-containing protein [Chitinophagaceae bacterium]|nr:T9SS type A sorting domain-containing protein [Chitinophagaceae bacterium]